MGGALSLFLFRGFYVFPLGAFTVLAPSVSSSRNRPFALSFMKDEKSSSSCVLLLPLGWASSLLSPQVWSYSMIQGAQGVQGLDTISENVFIRSLFWVNQFDRQEDSKKMQVAPPPSRFLLPCLLRWGACSNGIQSFKGQGIRSVKRTQGSGLRGPVWLASVVMAWQSSNAISNVISSLRRTGRIVI
jgi:hypothetical protein